MTVPLPVDVAIIGGGPAGSAAGSLLASWGHAVCVLHDTGDRSRGLAESIPPSTHKLLATIGALDAVERAAFYRGRGNTVWWASSRRRDERFDAPYGFQVFRPDFDRVLLETAAAAGARIEGARVRAVTFDHEAVRVIFEGGDGQRQHITSRIVLDCSGRAGVLARRFRRQESGQRTLGLVGVWRANESVERDLPDPSHTIVETFGEGWAWSVPTSAATRHVGAMVGEGAFVGDGSHGLERRYRQLMAKAPRLSRVLEGAALQRVFACDASPYASDTYASRQCLFVGDAGSFIDPLSSFGVKKALASAWLAAVAAHTSLAHPDRASIARDFFSDWERRVYRTHLRRSREFAREAAAAHDGPFWAARADVDVDAVDDVDDGVTVRSVFERFKAAPSIDLRIADAGRVEPRPVVRGNEIVLEPALAGGLRFAANVDLVRLAEIAPHYRQVPDLFEAYCRTNPPVPLPNIVGGLSLLVAKGILYETR